MKDICRTCMTKEVEMISIFDQTKSPSISEMIMAISSLEFSPNDALPSQVCVTCFKTLQMAYHFKEQVIQFNNVLQKQAQRIKLLARCKTFALQLEDQKTVDDGYFADVKNEHVIGSDQDLPTKNEPLLTIDGVYHPLLECNVKSELTLSSERHPNDLPEESSYSAAVNSHFKEADIKTEEVEVEEHGVQFGDNSQIIHSLSQNEVKDEEFCSEDILSLPSLHDITESQNVRQNFNENGAVTDEASEGTSHLKKRLNTNEVRPKRHKCAVCEKAFTKRYILLLHMRTHTGERPYKCQHCNARFTMSGSLKTHERLHNREVAPKSHNCDMCGKTFTTTNGLREHTRRHTGEKPFKCQHCNLKFVTISNLNQHIRKHTGEALPRRHKCGVCEKLFVAPFDLKVHMRGHTGERPFKCQHCNMSFKQRSCLTQHIRRKHLAETPTYENSFRLGSDDIASSR